ncbi:MAG TPA: hypothetical protein VHO72_15845 [Bacteroidales bacterium]|nr:hypothetical protein [Bacteroidales bacterium]
MNEKAILTPEYKQWLTEIRFQEFGQQPVDSIFHQPGGEIVQQPVGQIPWGYNILFYNKSHMIDNTRFLKIAEVHSGITEKSLLYRYAGKRKC